MSERGDELPQAEHQADVDVAPELVRHEVVRVVGQQDVEEVPGEERGRSAGRRSCGACGGAPGTSRSAGPRCRHCCSPRTGRARRRRSCSRMTSGAGPRRRTAFGRTVPSRGTPGEGHIGSTMRRTVVLRDERPSAKRVNRRSSRSASRAAGSGWAATGSVAASARASGAGARPAAAMADAGASEAATGSRPAGRRRP